MHVRKGDTVQVLAGRSRGVTGKVRQVLPKADRLIVEGVNIITRHIKPRPGLRQTGRVQMEGSIQSSNVMLVCPSCGRPTRVAHRDLEDGTKVRYCKHCSEQIG